MTVEPHVERSLEHAQAYLDALINAIPTPVLVKDHQHRYTAANAAFCNFFRRPASQIIGRNDFDFFSPEDAQYYQSTDAQALSLGTAIEYEHAYVLDGTTQWMLVRKSRLITPDGNQHVVLVLVDVTLRRAAEEALRHSEMRFRRLTELSADWYWEQDQQYCLTFLSAESGAKSGISPSLALGSTRWDVPGVDLASADWDSHKATCRAHQEFRNFVYRCVAEDGSERWISASGEPVFDASGKFLGYRGVGKNITRDIRAQNELRCHRDNLQQLVEERTCDLLSAKEAAEAANLAKSEFLSNISHELRTPMHAILSFTRLGLGKLASRNCEPARLVQYLSRVQESAQRLLLLLNNLLDLSKLEAGKCVYEFDWHDLRGIVHSVLAEMEVLIEQRRLCVECQYETNDLLAWCDALRIGQVVRNLLSNAIKFTPLGKRIRIHVCDFAAPIGHVPTETDRMSALQISVVDEGLGIPEAELESIFDKFVQSSQTKNGAGGTGLGLSITREIITQHGGHITAHNCPEGGAVFTFHLPRQPIARNGGTSSGP